MQVIQLKSNAEIAAEEFGALHLKVLVLRGEVEELKAERDQARGELERLKAESTKAATAVDS